MPLLDQIRAKRDEMYAIAEPYGISNIRVFGSVARGEERPDSDIDLLVHFDLDGRSGLDFVNAKHAVEAFLNQQAGISCKIDWVSDRGLHKLIGPIILSEAVPL